MSNVVNPSLAQSNIGAAIERLRGKWGAIVAFGVLLIILGAAALIYSFEATIATVSGIEHLRLHGALREAVAEQMLVAGEDGLLFFRHALLREAVYDDLLPGERVELHLALARALEQRDVAGGDGTAEAAGTIAGHYAAAGDQPAALRAFTRAARAAESASRAALRA